MSNERERMQILDLIENGKISADEGLHLLQALSRETEEQEPQAETPAKESAAAREEIREDEEREAFYGAELAAEETPAFEADKRPTWPAAADKWRRWWIIPLWVGVGITVAGGLLMFWVLQATGVNFWFFFAGLPLAFGVLIIVLAWSSRTARWLHLRVRQNTAGQPKNIALSFPLPLHLTSWFLRRFGHRIPNLKNTSIDEVIQALENSTSPESPMYIEVEEDDKKVEIYIG